MNKLFNLIFWSKIAISPILLSNAIGLFIYKWHSYLWWVWLIMFFFGLGLGIYWAEHIRKNEGTIRYLSKIYRNDDIKDFNDI